MRTDAILDTDIGGDPDDTFALLLALNSPEICLKLVVTGDEVAGKRATFAKRMLDALGRKVPVVQGTDLGNTYGFVVDELVAGSTRDGIGTEYLGAMRSLVDSSPSLVYICIQGMSNLANLLRRFPEVRGRFPVYQMGGMIREPPWVAWPEHNIKLDPESARYVLHSGCEIRFVGSHTTHNPVLTVDDQHAIFQRLKRSSNKAHHGVRGDGERVRPLLPVVSLDIQ